MKLPATRFDPASFDPKFLDRLSAVVFDEQRPALVGRDGVPIELPDEVFEILVSVVRAMKEGLVYVLIPENEPLSTQTAADMLGTSRQFLVKLLDSGAIPHHRVGTHRRVKFGDLRNYMTARDTARHVALNVLFQEVHAAGLPEVVPPDDHA